VNGRRRLATGTSRCPTARAPRRSRLERRRAARAPHRAPALTATCGPRRRHPQGVGLAGSSRACGRGAPYATARRAGCARRSRGRLRRLPEAPVFVMEDRGRALEASRGATTSRVPARSGGAFGWCAGIVTSAEITVAPWDRPTPTMCCPSRRERRVRAGHRERVSRGASDPGRTRGHSARRESPSAAHLAERTGIEIGVGMDRIRLDRSYVRFTSAEPGGCPETSGFRKWVRRSGIP